MRELVGTCNSCGKEIFCLDGFLNGVISTQKAIYCFDCYESIENKEKPQS